MAEEDGEGTTMSDQVTKWLADKVGVDPVVMHLVRARKAGKLTQMWVATQLGVSTSTVSLWESGGRHPRVEQVRKWAALFELAPTLVDIFGVEV